MLIILITILYNCITLIFNCVCLKVVQIKCSKFLITFVASEKANTGKILGLEKVLEPLLKDLLALDFS